MALAPVTVARCGRRRRPRAARRLHCSVAMRQNWSCTSACCARLTCRRRAESVKPAKTTCQRKTIAGRASQKTISRLKYIEIRQQKARAAIIFRMRRLLLMPEAAAWARMPVVAPLAWKGGCVRGEPRRHRRWPRIPNRAGRTRPSGQGRAGMRLGR